jgi:hypothetical protein
MNKDEEFMREARQAFGITKEWQDLSDEEVTDLANFWNISDISIEPFIDKVVRKLKEKNNGCS